MQDASSGWRPGDDALNESKSGIDGIELETGDSPDLSIIWLHGLGADGSDFVPIVDELRLPCGTRFVFPHAPTRPITINGGMVMRAWYDIKDFPVDAPVDRVALTESVAFVRTLIAREIDRGQRRDRIVLAGFSQGGAVALHAGLGVTAEAGTQAGADPGSPAAAPIGGVIALSTYLPAPDLLGTRESLASTVPVFLAHGTVDPVIPLMAGRNAADWLGASGVDVEWHSYSMAHEVSKPEIDDLSSWLARFRSR
jgi:phospholipase/carboxylesterase